MTRTSLYTSPRVLSALMMIALGSLGAACGLADPEIPTAPSPPSVTESFDGTFGQTGSTTHPFAVTEMGRVSIQLTRVSPLSTLALGVAVGSWNGENCIGTTILNNDARLNAVALAGTATPGDYCVRVFDSGNLTATTTVVYTIQVAHP